MVQGAEGRARIMRDAGMRYMIFTTKHHDGFCMFDTRQTDFSIASTPFAEEDGRDITAEVLRAFREQGFMTGTYFSKPDWSCTTGGTSMPHLTAGSTMIFPAIRSAGSSSGIIPRRRYTS